MKLYLASKTTHAPMWRALRDDRDFTWRKNRHDIRVTSTWIDEAGAKETLDWPDLWNRCLTEAKTADVLLVYREPGETLKGAWMEVGAALAHGVAVHGVGVEDFTVARSGLIVLHPDLPTALNAVRAA